MNTPTILLIEGSPADAGAIVDALAAVLPREEIGVCADGAEALDFFRCRGPYAGRSPLELPLFVLLDLRLPRGRGLDVLRDIRANPATRLLSVTVLSASDNPADIRAAAQLGANSFVRKSGDLRQMADNLRQLARYWLELNIPPPSRARQ